MENYFNLKGSYDDAKNNIIWCIWCNAMYCVYGKKKNTLFSIYHTLLLLLSAPPFWKVLIFYKAWCALIGQPSSALWLAEYLKRVTEMLRPLPYLETHSISTTWQRRWRQQYYSENKSYAFFLCINIWAVLCKSFHTVT